MQVIQYPYSAFNWPSAEMAEDYQNGAYLSGITEPWIQQVVSSLLIAKHPQRVLELGTYLGYTTEWLALALASLGGGVLYGVEIDEERCEATKQRLLNNQYRLDRIRWTIFHGDSLTSLPGFPNKTFDFAWVDDCHEAPHVDKELTLLRPKMTPGGLICMHDVSGPLGLDVVCRKHGGYVLDFPRLGPAGGLGIIQV